MDIYRHALYQVDLPLVPPAKEKEELSEDDLSLLEEMSNLLGMLLPGRKIPQSQRNEVQV